MLFVLTLSAEQLFSSNKVNIKWNVQIIVWEITKHGRLIDTISCLLTIKHAIHTLLAFDVNSKNWMFSYWFCCALYPTAEKVKG